MCNYNRLKYWYNRVLCRCLEDQREREQSQSPHRRELFCSVLCTGLSTDSVVLNLACLLESSGELYKVLLSPPPHLPLPNSYLIGVGFDLSIRIHERSPDDASVSQG